MAKQSGGIAKLYDALKSKNTCKAWAFGMGGVAMYYPEANSIVPGKLDPQSLTPVFKKVTVTISKVRLARKQ